MRIISSVLAISLVLTAVLGVVLTMPMAAGAEMAGSYCPAMGVQDGLCAMSALEHLAGWNHLFAARPTLLLALGALVGVGAFLLGGVDKEGASRHKWRFYTARGYIRKLFDRWLAALSRGLIQPRLYDAVIS